MICPTKYREKEESVASRLLEKKKRYIYVYVKRGEEKEEIERKRKRERREIKRLNATKQNTKSNKRASELFLLKARDITRTSKSPKAFIFFFVL
jgi:hypothetical protein